MALGSKEPLSRSAVNNSAWLDELLGPRYKCASCGSLYMQQQDALHGCKGCAAAATPLPS